MLVLISTLSGEIPGRQVSFSFGTVYSRKKLCVYTMVVELRRIRPH